MPLRDLALLEVRAVAAPVQADLLLRKVELDDAVHGTGQELAVVAHDDDACPQPSDELLEPRQSVQVEVVGGLVEQEHVVAAEQQRCQSGTCRLAAGQGRHRTVEVDREPEIGGHGRSAGVEVRSAEVEPVVEGCAVRVVGGHPVDRLARAERVTGFVQVGLRRGDSRTSTQELEHRLARAPLRLLRQVADGGRHRGPYDLAALRSRQAGHDPQQRGLARAVRADQTDHVTRGDDEVETGEQRAVAVPGGEAAGDESAHDGVDVTGWADGSPDRFGWGSGQYQPCALLNDQAPQAVP